MTCHRWIWMTDEAYTAYQSLRLSTAIIIEKPDIKLAYEAAQWDPKDLREIWEQADRTPLPDLRAYNGGMMFMTEPEDE